MLELQFLKTQIFPRAEKIEKILFFFLFEILFCLHS